MKIVEREVSESGIIKIRVDAKWDETGEIDRWCREHQCGKLVALKRFAFRTEEELTMFTLKWE